MTPSLAVLVALALAAFGAIGAVAGALWMKSRTAAALRQATEDHARLLGLADHWVWETDAAHRLTGWRVPARRPAAWRASPAMGSPLDAIALPLGPGGLGDAASAAPAGSVLPTALARQLAAHAPIPEQRVVLRLGETTGVWALRGEPRHDGEGYFLGYVGSARPVGEIDAAEFGQAALVQLLTHLDTAVLLFRRADEAAPWKLAAQGAGAHALLGVAADCNEHSPESPDWATACARLPADVAYALSQMPAGETRAVGDWRVSWAAVGSAEDAQAGRLVVLRKAAAPSLAMAAASAVAVVATPSEAVAAVESADHESFIYSVSHDLRAPIRVVEGFARILKEDYGRFLDRIGNDHTDRILAAAARMNSMIDSLLALSRLQSQPIKRQPVDLSQLTRYVLEDLRSNEPEREAEIHIEPGLVIQGDPTLMRIAIENLVGNAWKYSSQSPTTRIELRRETLAGTPTFVIADAGAGFDMRFADRLFGVFQRLHSAK
ncbi:MAG: histidine kinase dimerization/phospho-acceptor domain-containing protein, partial [Betaproteobacteria bacterium]